MLSSGTIQQRHSSICGSIAARLRTADAPLLDVVVVVVAVEGVCCVKDRFAAMLVPAAAATARAEAKDKLLVERRCAATPNPMLCKSCADPNVLDDCRVALDRWLPCVVPVPPAEELG